MHQEYHCANSRQDEAFLEWGNSHNTVAVVIELFMVVYSYLYFRIWRYVEIFPSGQGTSASGDQRVFIRRASPNPDTWGLRLALIILAAVAVVAGPTILIILAVLTENFLS